MLLMRHVAAAGAASATRCKLQAPPATALARRWQSGTSHMRVLANGSSFAWSTAAARAGCRRGVMFATTTTTAALATAGLICHATSQQSSRAFCAGSAAGVEQYVVTASGLQYLDQIVGDGDSPSVGEAPPLPLFVRRANCTNPAALSLLGDSFLLVGPTHRRHGAGPLHREAAEQRPAVRQLARAWTT